ncbi:MutS-related protein [Diplocloster hominis]|uniref:MutS-related protein n=1 Tax=Diplocloster hominis TaxID=3079010 RepID=UPI0031BBAD9E
MNEYWFVAIAVGAVLLIVFLKLFYDRINWERKRERKIALSWGKQPEQEYTAEEFDSISHFCRRRHDGVTGIDDITWNDLDMDEVFMLVNHTWSSPGQECLYDMMRTPVYEKSVLEERERLISYFASHESERRSVEKIYAKMGRVKGVSLADYIYWLADLTEMKLVPHIIMAVLALAGIVSIFVAPAQGIIFFIVVMCVNIMNYFSRKKEIEPYISAFAFIIKMMDTAKELEKLNIREIEKYQAEMKKTSRQFNKFRKNSFLVLAGQGGMNEDPLAMILDYIRMVFHVDLIKFNWMLKEVKLHLKDAELFIEQIGMLESMIAIANFREMMPYVCLPELLQGENVRLEAENIYHPLVEHAVASTIQAKRGVLLTGSNASGKSTFLKTIAINAILAQTIHTALADRYQGNYFRIYSSMALKDNLMGQESYFIVEIKSLKRILDAVDKEHPVLCFVDEVLRGTNTVERIAASSEILKSLNDAGVLCFAATHDIELTYILENSYDNYHFREEIKDQDILFDYCLREGRATSRNAIRLLGLIGYDEEIINKAENMATRFAEEGVWALSE